MPTYNEKNPAIDIQQIPNDCVNEVVLVNDSYFDQTARIVPEHSIPRSASESKDYGAHEKTGHHKALNHGTGIVAMAPGTNSLLLH